jgi:hypothetical protein
LLLFLSHIAGECAGLAASTGGGAARGLVTANMTSTRVPRARGGSTIDS